MSDAYTIAAAIRHCQACLAMPLARDWHLVDRITSDRCAPGQQVQVRLDGMPLTDSRGRHAHIRGLYIRAAAKLVVAGATNDAVESYVLRGVINSINIRDCEGHTYLENIDGRTVLDDQFFRFGSVRQLMPLRAGAEKTTNPAGEWDETVTVSADFGLAVNAGVNDYLRDASIYIPFQYPGKSRLRGLVPLAMLRARGADAFTFRVASALVDAPAGVSFTGLSNVQQIAAANQDGCEVWAEVCYLDGLVMDPGWELRNYTLADLSGVLLSPEQATEYLWLRYFVEDTNASYTMDGLSISSAGWSQIAGAPIDDVVSRMVLNRLTEDDGSFRHAQASSSLPLFDPSGNIAALELIPYRDRGGLCAGPVSYKANSRTADFFRFVHRTVGCHTPNRANALQKATGCGPCRVVGLDPQGSACGSVMPHEPALAVPRRTAQPGRRMSYGVR